MENVCTISVPLYLYFFLILFWIFVLKRSRRQSSEELVTELVTTYFGMQLTFTWPRSAGLQVWAEKGAQCLIYYSHKPIYVSNCLSICLLPLVILIAPTCSPFISGHMQIANIHTSTHIIRMSFVSLALAWSTRYSYSYSYSQSEFESLIIINQLRKFLNKEIFWRNFCLALAKVKCQRDTQRPGK